MYHYLLEAKKTLEMGAPKHLYEKLVGEWEGVSKNLPRQRVGVDMVTNAFKLELTRKSLRFRVRSQDRQYRRKFEDILN